MPPLTTTPTPLPPSIYRLLYRGALSLPDSHLLLDGLTFAARLESPSKHSHLLQNPLALALESMRGRPSLRLLGVTKLGDAGVWMDESGGVEVDIHPRATLTRIYFENIFCLRPLASTSTASLTSPHTPSVGIKVALGDGAGPDTTEIVIYAHPLALLSNDQGNRTVQLAVARITHHPPPRPLLSRIPRPDDPTPRKPPVFLGTGGNGAKRELKRLASASGGDVKRQKLAGINRDEHILARLGSGVRFGGERGDMGEDEALFKVPGVPLTSDHVGGRAKRKGKERQIEQEADVFGSVSAGQMSGKLEVESKGKRKRDAGENGAGKVAETERANKNTIKRHTLDLLSSTKDPTASTVDKSDPEFKELFGWVYRGVGYALRAQIKLYPVDVELVNRLVKLHLDMYIGGCALNMAPNGTDTIG